MSIISQQYTHLDFALRFPNSVRYNKIIFYTYRINLPFTGMASVTTGQPLRNEMANEILGNDVQPASLVQASEAVSYSRSFKGK